MGRERNLVIDNRLEDFTPVTNIKGEINRDGLRRMTPREWARLQGYPDTFTLPFFVFHLFPPLFHNTCITFPFIHSPLYYNLSVIFSLV